MKSIRDADRIFQVDDFYAYRHIFCAQPPNFLVMISLNESIARLKERHTNFLPSEQSILQKKIDTLTHSQNFHLTALFPLPPEEGWSDHVARLRKICQHFILWTPRRES